MNGCKWTDMSGASILTNEEDKVLGYADHMGGDSWLASATQRSGSPRELGTFSGRADAKSAVEASVL
jgi:hypothetical protein